MPLASKGVVLYRATLSNKADIGLLMHMLIVTGEIAGCGCGWWTHRAHRIGARTD